MSAKGDSRRMTKVCMQRQPCTPTQIQLGSPREVQLHNRVITEMVRNASNEKAIRLRPSDVLMNLKIVCICDYVYLVCYGHVICNRRLD